MQTNIPFSMLSSSWLSNLQRGFSDFFHHNNLVLYFVLVYKILRLWQLAQGFG